MDESTVRDMVAELRATLRAVRAELVVSVAPDHWVDDAGVRHER